MGSRSFLRRGAAPLAVAIAVATLSTAVVPATEADAAITRAYASAGRYAVGPGARYDWGDVQTEAGRQIVSLVELTAGVPGTRLETALSNERVAGLELTTDMANRSTREGHHVVAAINGDFWGRSQEPYGMHIQNGELVSSGRSTLPTIGYTAGGKAVMGSPRITAGVTRGTSSFSIGNVNGPRSTSGMTLYTPRFDTHTRTPSTGTEVVLSGVPLPLPTHGSWLARVERVVAGGNTALTAGRVVLSGAGTAASFLSGMSVGNEVRLTLSISSGWEGITQALGGKEWLLRNGTSVAPGGTDFYHEPQPRSAIGLTATGDVVMATVAGRRRGFSKGLTLAEMATLLKSRGAVNAFNLDGGGSSTVAVRQPGDRDVSVVSYPSDGYQRAVSNALLVVSSAPTGPLDRVLVRPASATVLAGSHLDYVAKGQDAAQNPVAIDPATVAWSITGSAASIAPNGRLAGVAAGSATVRATVGTRTATTPVTVVTSLTSMTVSPSLVALPRAAKRQFSVTALNGSRPVAVDTAGVAWSASAAVGTIDASGLLTAAGRAGSGYVTGKAGGLTRSVRIQVGDAVLIGAGNIARCPEANGPPDTGDETTAAILGAHPGTVFTTGDNAFKSGFGWQYNSCYGDSWGRYRERTRPSAGDIDYKLTGAYGYYGYFGDLAGKPGEGWYAYDQDRWRIYVLNSNCVDIGGCGTGSAQERWLTADLAANPKACVAAYWHHGPFSSGQSGPQSRMAVLLSRLYSAGAEIIVNGHDRDYERFAPQDPSGRADATRGIRAFMVGTGGEQTTAFGTVRANSQFRDASSLGVLKLVLRPTGYEWRWIVPGGTIRDSGTGTCH